MQNTMLDSTVSSDSQEPFFGFNFVVLVLMFVLQMWYGRKRGDGLDILSPRMAVCGMVLQTPK